MQPIVLFGAGKIAEVMLTYLRRDRSLDVVACAVDPEHVRSAEFHGLPMVPSDQLAQRFPPDGFQVFVAVGYQRLNVARLEIMTRLEALGYRVPAIVSAHAHVAPGVVLGDGSAVLDAACVQPGATLGRGAFVWTGAMIGHHSIVGEGCWITGNASLSGSVKLGARSFVGAGAVLGHEITVGADAILGAGTILTHDLPAGGVLVAGDTQRHRLDSAQFQRITRMF